jgi:hypothetical protein
MGTISALGGNRLPQEMQTSFLAMVGINAVLLVIASLAVSRFIVLVWRNHRITGRLMSLMPGINRGCSYYLAQTGGYAFVGMLMAFFAAGITGSLAPLGLGTGLMLVLVVVFFVPMMLGLLFAFVAVWVALLISTLAWAVMPGLDESYLGMLSTVFTAPWSNLAWVLGFTYGIRRRNDQQIARLICSLGRPKSDDRSMAGE